jgi:hypothetical protein
VEKRKREREREREKDEFIGSSVNPFILPFHSTNRFENVDVLMNLNGDV